MGPFVVSPSTHPTDCGRFFRASFSVHRSQGSGSYSRVFRFDKAFASREAARLFAVTQGGVIVLFVQIGALSPETQHSCGFRAGAAASAGRRR